MGVFIMSDGCDDIDKLKVKVRQSEDGRKKKIRIKNEYFKISIRVKDREIICEDVECHDEH
jgi:hypothetical protein